MRLVLRYVASGCVSLAILAMGAAWTSAQDEADPAQEKDAQEVPANTPQNQVKEDDAKIEQPSVDDPGQGYRMLADGVMHTVSPETQPIESWGWHNIIGILNQDPLFGQRIEGEGSAYIFDVLSPATLVAPPESVAAMLEADNNAVEGELQNPLELVPKNIKLEHPAWGLEFSFKTMRVIWVDVPTPARTGQEVVQQFDKNNNKKLDGEELTDLANWVDQNKGKPPAGGGRFDRKLIWYLLFNVKNPGPQPVKFLPRIYLNDEETGTWYPSRIIPVAMDGIRAKEDPRRKLLNTVEISEVEVPPNNEGEVWGVATWEDVSPDIDFFSVYVQGLTNAFQREAVEGQDGKPEWKFSRKTLQLRFWRPGDRYHENDGEFRYGQPGLAPYAWSYK